LRSSDAGYHWFFYASARNIDIATLAYNILVVSLLGALLVVLASRVPYERAVAILAFPRSGGALFIPLLLLLFLTILAYGLAKIGVL
jgi:hypothetical protein